MLPEPIKLTWLKEEEKILATFTPDQVSRIVHWKPSKRAAQRLYALALTAIDTGLRVSELLGLSREDLDMENLVIRVKGKGNKHRLVPMSVELRRVLYKQIGRHRYGLVFCTRDGGRVSQRDVLRDFKKLCGILRITGVRCSFHTLRHYAELRTMPSKLAGPLISARFSGRVSA